VTRWTAGPNLGDETGLLVHLLTVVAEERPLSAEDGEAVLQCAREAHDMALEKGLITE
jgi:hypothetical protein